MLKINDSKKTIEKLFSFAGVSIDGNLPHDIQVHNDNFYQRILSDGVLGLGESYMDEWWNSEALDQFINKILIAKIEEKIAVSWKLKWLILKSKVFNLQKISRAYQIGERHYDIGNDLYKAMLDKRMVYSCGYWKNADNLDEAQEAKLELICKKINLESGMSVLDLGCGWGSFAKYAAQKYSAKITAVTVSKQQVELGRKLCNGLPVQILLEDYRNVSGIYDRVISIGFLEHIGYKNYRTYMETVYRCLKEDGIAFIQTIGGNFSSPTTNAWTAKYIFPNSMLPSVAYLGNAMEKLFVVEDWHNFGPDYDKTLLAWYSNFEESWPQLKEKYGDKFYRIWKFYLLSSAVGFRSRRNHLWQIVMTKQGREQPNCRIG